jgi:hypothetical protein
MTTLGNQVFDVLHDMDRAVRDHAEVGVEPGLDLPVLQLLTATPFDKQATLERLVIDASTD